MIPFFLGGGGRAVSGVRVRGVRRDNLPKLANLQLAES